jgi:hypothetical protein
MKTDFKIDRQLANLISGNISKKDLELLTNWGKQSKENQKLLKMLSKDKDLKDRLSDYYSLKSPIHWSTMKAKIKRTKRRIVFTRLSRIAAAIILPLAIGFGVYMIGISKQENYQEIAKQFKPAEKNATLLMSNNIMMKLDTMQIGQLSLKNNVSIIKESKGKLSYKQLLKNTLKQEVVEFHTLNVAKGEEFMIELSDGTKIWLNSDSRIKYPVVFTGKKREVTLEKGEAYFEVAHDTDKKFVVTTKKSIIQVLGTSFNISAYEDEPEITTLVEGSVNLHHRYDVDLISSVNLKPGEQAKIITINKKINIKKVNAEQYAAWKDGIFYFNYEPIELIMKKLSRWYNVKFAYETKDVKSIVFYGKIKRHESIDKLLEMIKLTNKIDYSIKDDIITIKKI